MWRVVATQAYPVTASHAHLWANRIAPPPGAAPITWLHFTHPQVIAAFCFAAYFELDQKHRWPLCLDEDQKRLPVEQRETVVDGDHVTSAMSTSSP